MTYQLVVLGPTKAQFLGTLQTALEERVKDLGLKPSRNIAILQAHAKHNIDWDSSPVSVWFGGSDQPDQADCELLEKLVKETIAIFPVVHASEHYCALVPEALHRINCYLWESASDSVGRDSLVTNILSAFRLVRSQRQAFISYKRSDTRGVALQLFDALSQHAYQPFLDTWSVESGEDFQKVLWGRMADVDLLIFLDSPHALSSSWVYEELARAHDLGLGVLQLLWPNHQPTQGTELSELIPLQLPSDFVHGTAGPEDILQGATVAKVIAAAERARIRSLQARRLRVIADLVDQANHLGLEAIVLPTDPIVLYRQDEQGVSTEVGVVIPFIGLPDAPAVQQAQERWPANQLPMIIGYNGLGVQEDWAAHLAWLNQRKDILGTIQVDAIDSWLKGLR
jgi:TIR domain